MKNLLFVALGCITLVACDGPDNVRTNTTQPANEVQIDNSTYDDGTAK